MRETLTQIFLTGFTDGSFQLSVADRNGHNTLAREPLSAGGAREIAAVVDSLLGSRVASQVVGLTIRQRDERLSELRRSQERIASQIAELEGRA